MAACSLPTLGEYPHGIYKLHRDLQTMCYSVLTDGLLQCPWSPVLCRIYVSEDSYISTEAQSSVRARQLLAQLADGLDWPQEDMVLAALTYSGGKDTDNRSLQK